MTLIHTALQSHLPVRARRQTTSQGQKITFNCPVCQHLGHRPDDRQRGAVFLNNDGGAGYSCFNCQFATRQEAGKLLALKMEDLLGYMGMSQDDRRKLRFDIWHEHQSAMRNAIPKPQITKQPLPEGAEPISDWIARETADLSFKDVLEHLDDMTTQLRDSYYWTPIPGNHGFNRRYIWVFGPPDDPVGWAAKSIDTDDEPLLSDRNIWFYGEEED